MDTATQNKLFAAINTSVNEDRIAHVTIPRQDVEDVIVTMWQWVDTDCEDLDYAAEGGDKWDIWCTELASGAQNWRLSISVE